MGLFGHNPWNQRDTLKIWSW